MMSTLASHTDRAPGSPAAVPSDASYGRVESRQAMSLDGRRKTPVPTEIETALLAGAKAGDAEAFASLIRYCDKYIYRVAFNITRNREDAEDVQQETILKAYTHLGEFRGESRFHTWLVRITLNEAMMKIRKRSSARLDSLDRPIGTDERSSMPREIRDCAAENPEEHYANAELQSILAEAIGKLAPQFRAVFLLRYVENFSTEETAAMLGMRVPAVKSRLLRARLKLRQLLAPRFKLSGAHSETRCWNLNAPEISEHPVSGFVRSEPAPPFSKCQPSCPHRLGVQEP